MSFEDFCGELEGLAKRYGDVPVRVERAPGRAIARAYGPGTTPVDVARDGLDGVSELASGTAEHHPYWGAVSGCAGILETLLDRWDGSLTDEDLSQMRWDLGRIGRALEQK